MNYKFILEDPASGADQTAWVLPIPVTVGRSPVARICIGDESISRRHCEFTLDSQGALAVRDLGSMNGTYVDERRITKAVLKPGDRVRIGALTLRVEWTDDEALETPTYGEPCDATRTQPMKILPRSQWQRGK